MENLYACFKQSTGVSIDSRKIHENCMFIALKGPTFNGNEYANEAISKGAKFAIVDELQYADESRGIYLVENSLKFLQDLACYHRKQFDIPVIGITGSNGKTTTKELIATVLSQKYNVLATVGNFNNHIGVPLTLLNLTQKHEIAVVEMGANHFGDIKELCDIALPNYGIITNIGKAHLEGFLNFEGVLQTKRELYDAVEQNEGLLVFNNNDSVLVDILPPNTMLMSYGISDATVTGKLEKLTPFIELSWSTEAYKSPVITTNLVGQYNFFNFLAAIAFGVLFGVEKEKINHAVSSYTPNNKRSQVVKTNKNILIMDCYNANPTSMRSALESFAMISHPNKLVIIGDMLELGKESKMEHEEIIRLVNQLDLKGFSVGAEFGQVVDASLTNYSSASAVIEMLKENHLQDYLVLLKGSRGIGLEVLEEFL
ncbi:MAG TPA: UDP-N-acetylmuramoyl-tripeptide--D-alanyl-D-alanine ligase [Taishania sp.]|nr:UDP-N-acetylmuramoyl-tripeptide--D-alanyl-D-alanine ligase [Taishania sp.]